MTTCKRDHAPTDLRPDGRSCRPCYNQDMREWRVRRLANNPLVPTAAEAARFWSHIDRGNPSECWPWRAAEPHGRYGRVIIAGETLAHRAAYRMLVGPIPDGLTIDHLCRNRACVNPAHMEPVTTGENVLRGVGLSAENARKTHCKRGHELVSPNMRVGSKGERVCRACMRAWRAERKDAA